MSANFRSVRHFGLLAALHLAMLGFLLATPSSRSWWWINMAVALFAMFWAFMFGFAMMALGAERKW